MENHNKVFNEVISALEQLRDNPDVEDLNTTNIQIYITTETDSVLELCVEVANDGELHKTFGMLENDEESDNLMLN